MIFFHSHRPFVAKHKRVERHISVPQTAVPEADSGIVFIHWIGPGQYRRQPDQVFRHSAALKQGGWGQSHSFHSRQEIPNRLLVIDGAEAIRRSIQAVALPVARFYTGLTQDECRALSEIADHWSIPWAWSVGERARFLRRPQEWCTFNAAFGNQNRYNRSQIR